MSVPNKFVSSLCLVLGISVSWVCSTQLQQFVMKASNGSHKRAVPTMFSYWFITNWKILCMIPLWIHDSWKSHQRKQHSRMQYRIKVVNEEEAEREEEEDDDDEDEKHEDSITEERIQPMRDDQSDIEDIRQGISNWTLMKEVPLFYLLAFVANYTFLKSLNYLSASEVTALFNSEPAWIYLMTGVLSYREWASSMDGDQCTWTMLRVTCVIISILGVVIVELSNDGWKMPSSLSVWLPIISSISAAAYLVSFSHCLSSVNVWNVARFSSFLGLFNFVFGWPLVLVASAVSHSEHLPWNHLDDLPWLPLCMAGLCSLLFDGLITFGAVFAYPLFVSLGLVFGIPLNVIADSIFHGETPGFSQGFGIALIFCAFVGFVLTDHWRHRKLTQQSDGPHSLLE